MIGINVKRMVNLKRKSFVGLLIIYVVIVIDLSRTKLDLIPHI